MLDHPSIHPSIHASVYLSAVCLSVCLSIYLSIYLSIRLSISRVSVRPVCVYSDRCSLTAMSIKWAPSENSLTSFQLTGEGDQFAVLGFEIVTNLQQDEQLRPPVLDVRWSVLETQQSKSRRRHRQSTNTVTPLLLGPELTTQFKHYNPCVSQVRIQGNQAAQDL